MPKGLVDTAAQIQTPEEPRFQGIAIAQVVNNVDPCGTARVQIRYPWLPGTLAWARVAAPGAGLGRGTYSMPQIGDEVVVGFQNGDERQPLVIGSLWNQVDRPKLLSPTDAKNALVIRSRLGNELRIDDAPPSIKFTSAGFQQITLGPNAIELRTGGQSIVITLVGDGISISAQTALTISAPEITLKGGKVNISAGSIALAGKTDFKPPVLT